MLTISLLVHLSLNGHAPQTHETIFYIYNCNQLTSEGTGSLACSYLPSSSNRSHCPHAVNDLKLFCKCNSVFVIYTVPGCVVDFTLPKACVLDSQKKQNMLETLLRIKVQSTLEVRAEENIKDTADPRNGAQSSAQPPTETTGGLRARERRQSEDAQILAEERQQSSTEAAQVVAGATPAGDYIVKEAIQAASQEARTIAEQMLKHHAESEQMNKEMIASLQCEISSLSMDLKFLQTTQKQDGSTQPTAATKAPETLVEERRVAEDEQSIGEQQAQNCAAIGHNSRTSQQAQPAVNPIDSYPKLSDRIGQLEAFVQRLERAHCTLEERLNNSVPQLEAMVRSLQTAHGNDQVQDQKEDHDHGKELKEKQTETRASELQTEVTEDATLKEFAAPLAQA